jgi:hypothetical protein
MWGPHMTPQEGLLGGLVATSQGGEANPVEDPLK